MGVLWPLGAVNLLMRTDFDYTGSAAPHQRKTPAGLTLLPALW
jgi:hypothetical protein